MPLIDFFSTHPPFDSLSQADLEAVIQALQRVHFPAGSHILRRGGPPSDSLYLIRRGAVRLENEGRVLQVLEEGEMFGYPSLLSQTSRALDVLAEEETEIYRIPGDLFRRLLEQPPFAEFFLKGLGERLRRAMDFEASPLAGDLASPAEALITRPPIFIDAGANIAQAAQAMRRAWASSVLVGGEPPGIITDRDLRNRVLAERLGPETPVRQVMTCPAKSLPAETPVYGALLFMLQENIHHLPLTRQGEVVGIITDTDLLRHQAKSPLYLLRQVETISKVEALAQYALEVAGMVETLFRSGLDVAQIGRMVASLNDALTKRLLQLAEDELGPPPADYAWIVFGSEGRLEQTLLTDQDNALVYRAEGNDGQAESYFQQLARRVIDGLINAGFPPCPGGYMASNWCYPLEAWERRFKGWVRTPDPEALLKIAIFFDFRAVHGALSLDSLEEIFLGAGERGLFLSQLARASLTFRPPLGFFRRIRAEAAGVNLKRGGIAPIVGLARLCALEAGDPARSTISRLEAATGTGTLGREGAEVLIEAFRFILHLRLRAQLQAYRSGEPASNHMPLDTLSPLERRHLKDSFQAIREAQQMTALRFQTGRLG